MQKSLAERRNLGDIWRVRGQKVPPTALVLMAMGSVQIGASLAHQLFPLIGTTSTVFLRTVFAAIMLMFIWRPRLRGYTRRQYMLILVYGAALAGMNSAFYASISRIPLGIAVTLEFVGPLGVAIVGSRRVIDVLWVILAGLGILLLAPIGTTTLDGVGITLALVAGLGWAAYIVLGGEVGRNFAGGTGLALGLAVSSIMLAPIGIAGAGSSLFTPAVLVIGLGVSILSSAIPFSLEFIALQRIPARVFGVLMSMEPAAAALIGFIFLGEKLDLRDLIAIILVTIAAVGASRFSARSTDTNQVIDEMIANE